MEADTADGTVVFVEAIDQGTHAVVPQLDHTAVQGREDPWALRVEAQALDAVALGLCEVDDERVKVSDAFEHGSIGGDVVRVGGQEGGGCPGQFSGPFDACVRDECGMGRLGERTRTSNLVSIATGF